MPALRVGCLRGRIGDGRGTIRIDTGSGGVRLMRRGANGRVGVGAGIRMMVGPEVG